jgi:RHS repeat-associated protein
MEQHAYDPLWRMVAIYRRLAVDPQTGQRPPPVLYQRFVYHAAGAGGAFSTGIGMDRPILRQRDTDGNGAPDETLYYLFDRRGSIVGLAQAVLGDSAVGLEGEGEGEGEPTPTIGRTLVERVRYNPFGVPTCYVPSDLNRDGVTNDEDVASNYYRFSKEPLPAYDDRFDINFDGLIDGVDEAIYWEQYAAIDKSWHAGDFRGEGRLSFAATELGGTKPGVTQALPQTGFAAAGQLDIDNRFGYAGYIWDQHLGIYHVRHRAYDPFAGRWLQPDPLAMMGPELLLALTSSDGSNLYAYVGNNPNGFVDPYGLWSVADVVDELETIADMAQYMSGGGQAGAASEIWSEFGAGLHDGYVVTTNQAGRAFTGGLVGSSLQELAANGALYDPDNEYLVVSQVAGSVAGVALSIATPGGLSHVAMTSTSIRVAKAAHWTGHAFTAWGMYNSVDLIVDGYFDVASGDPNGYWKIALGGIGMGGNAWAGAGGFSPKSGMVNVSRWGAPFGSGDDLWVMVGPNTRINLVKSGKADFGSVPWNQSVNLSSPGYNARVHGESLRWPSGWEWWKGLMGQRRCQ